MIHAYDCAVQLEPQNPARDSTLTTSAIEQLRTDLATLLQDPRCAQFVQGVLMQIKAVTGTAAYSNKIMDILMRSNHKEASEDGLDLLPLRLPMALAEVKHF